MGKNRYQIGAIVLDKTVHRLVIPAHVAHLGEAPLEYLAVTKGGLKAYETLLEADASGTELNLALILLGFNAELSSHLAFQFDRNLPGGQTATIRIRWGNNEISADEALLSDEQRKTIAPAVWVYLGSFINPPDGRFAADSGGTLIGFVHDPGCLIDHRLGLGIGAYGSVRGNSARLPPVGTPVEIVVTATGRLVKSAPPAPPAPPASPAAPAGPGAPAAPAGSPTASTVSPSMFSGATR
ncbi:MAG: hypothetical protein JSR67_11140 [Proteobacteria bacterium]|nr:hypothetical protein [Pseudomonadota bacterium]